MTVSLPPELLTAYRQTDYAFRVGSREACLRIDKRSPELVRVHAAHGVRSSAYITAWNPASEPLSFEENERLNRSLARDIERLGLEALPAEARADDGEWRERSFLVLGPTPDQARDLARAYGQIAYLFASSDGIPRLVAT